MACPSVFPGSLDSYTAKTDSVDDVMAVDVNELQSAIVAIETKLGTGQFHAATGDGATWGFKAGAALDVLLYRGAANLWRTPDSLTVDVGLNVGSASGATTGQVRASAGFLPDGVTTHGFRAIRIGNLADDGIAAISPVAAAFGFVFITERSVAGSQAIYLLNGGYHTTTEISDPSSKFTPTATTDNMTNIYWSAANSRYELENKMGNVENYDIWLLIE